MSKETKEVFRNFYWYLIEFLDLGKYVNKQFIEANVTVNGAENIDNSLAKGKGAIIMTAHIGNWEFGAALVAWLGHDITAVALAHKETQVNNFFNYQRESNGFKVMPTNQSVRNSLKLLKENKCVAMVGDRTFGTAGETLDFLGQKAIIPKGIALFSLKTGAPIIPTFLTRNNDNTFVLSIEEPIYPDGPICDKVDEVSLLNLMKRHTAIIEKKIHKFPTQWLMFREYSIQ